MDLWDGMFFVLMRIASPRDVNPCAFPQLGHSRWPAEQFPYLFALALGVGGRLRAVVMYMIETKAG